jgi:hypothetical protein
MRDEEIRIGRVDDQDADRLVGGDLLGKAADLVDQRHVQQIDGRIVDRRPADATRHGDANKLVVLVCHERTLREVCAGRMEVMRNWLVIRLSSGITTSSR